MRAIFNVSLIVKDKVTRQCLAQTTTFEEKEDPKQIRTEVLLLTSLTPYRYAKPAHTPTLETMELYTDPCLKQRGGKEPSLLSGQSGESVHSISIN